MAVPVIVLYESDQGHGLTDVAKLFTEINTLADALNEELSHYLAYKFKIMGYKKMAYDLPSDEMNEDEKRLRIQNRESYRLACDLNQSETFRNGICLIPGKNAVTRITPRNGKKRHESGLMQIVSLGTLTCLMLKNSIS